MLSEAFHENHFKLTKPKLSSLFKPSGEEKERKKSVSASATIAIVCKVENEPKNTFCRSKNWITVDRFRPGQPNIAIDVGNLMPLAVSKSRKILLTQKPAFIPHHSDFGIRSANSRSSASLNQQQCRQKGRTTHRRRRRLRLNHVMHFHHSSPPTTNQRLLLQHFADVTKLGGFGEGSFGGEKANIKRMVKHKISLLETVWTLWGGGGRESSSLRDRDYFASMDGRKLRTQFNIKMSIQTGVVTLFKGFEGKIASQFRAPARWK
ncbi:conserved hypothetical protein [Culex quinquefasciatus]|uniref:Uncharacterized protein n=1 Tax=Culex quinquefasciatus TaxID=7176 RepID=B0X6U8_CULQU|nr:conserved hypothetical protein [Culex quinquefasciatus]|eukprot:XP_001865370.1 conserved hypothetical protein [Culex quinquefasciatus]